GLRYRLDGLLRASSLGSLRELLPGAARNCLTLTAITDRDPHQASVAERPVALTAPAGKRERTIPHPIAIRCLAHTIEAAQKSAEADDHLADSSAEDMERLASSREAVLYSQDLLAKLRRDNKAETKKIAPRVVADDSLSFIA